MGIKTYNPYTPSRRNMTGSDFSEITKKTPEKSLCYSLKKNSGRNNQGKITVRHQGGGVRRQYRVIDFKRNKDGIPATVIGIEYDPNRTANIALICYADGTKSYIIAPEGLTDGMKVMNGPEAEVRLGNCLPLSEIPVGTQVHNVELYPGKGGQLVRSAGNSAQLMAKEGKYATHGGGEGKNGIGRPGPSTPWGKPALGLKTRKKKASDKLIVRRRNGRAMK